MSAPFSPAARTRTSTSPCPGTGSACSSTRSSPSRSVTAFTCFGSGYLSPGRSTSLSWSGSREAFFLAACFLAFLCACFLLWEAFFLCLALFLAFLWTGFFLGWGFLGVVVGCEPVPPLLPVEPPEVDGPPALGARQPPVWRTT